MPLAPCPIGIPIPLPHKQRCDLPGVSCTELDWGHPRPPVLPERGRTSPWGLTSAVQEASVTRQGREWLREDLRSKSPSGKGNPDALAREMPGTHPPGCASPRTPSSPVVLKGYRQRQSPPLTSPSLGTSASPHWGGSCEPGMPRRPEASRPALRMCVSCLPPPSLREFLSTWPVATCTRIIPGPSSSQPGRTWGRACLTGSHSTLVLTKVEAAVSPGPGAV